MDENYQRYLELIENFYRSKNYYLSGGDKFSKCNKMFNSLSIFKYKIIN